VTVSAEVCEYAEMPDRFSQLGASVERFADARVCILQGPTWASVSGVSIGEDEVEALVGEVRARVAAEKEPVWWIGPSARPRDLYERLAALGLAEPRDRVASLRALALAEAPADSPVGVEVLRVDSYEQFVAACELQWEAFETPEERRARNRVRLRVDFDDAQHHGTPVRFLATVEGRPAATAMAVPSRRGVFLIGGATAPWARGRGLYRALIRARWDYAAARGTPALVVAAVLTTSYPILRRLGFQDVCEIVRVEDRHEPSREHLREVTQRTT
jgi:Acetyltransferase (GNAT) family